MRILITGAAGFVGVHMAAHVLANTDWEVVILDSFRHKGKTDRIRDLLEAHPEYRDRIKVIMHDLRAPISEQLEYELGKIDYVLSIASESHVDRSITDPRDFIENNTMLMLTMLEWLRKTPSIKKFIQISTDEVYGPAEHDDHPEGDPHRPSNPYAASKAAQEDLCFAYWRTYNLPIIITNTMNMFGSLQESEKFVPLIIKTLKEGGTVKVHASPEGIPGSRYYLHVRNQCDALLYILNNVKPIMYGDQFIDVESYDPELGDNQPKIPFHDLLRLNVVSQDEIDNEQMVKLVAKYMGVEPKYELIDFHTSRPGHDRRYGLTGYKLASLGWKQPVPFDQSLRETVEWYLKRPEWLL